MSLLDLPSGCANDVEEDINGLCSALAALPLLLPETPITVEEVPQLLSSPLVEEDGMCTLVEGEVKFGDEEVEEGVSLLVLG